MKSLGIEIHTIDQSFELFTASRGCQLLAAFQASFNRCES
jgi:hypothetical protein